MLRFLMPSEVVRAIPACEDTVAAWVVAAARGRLCGGGSEFAVAGLG